MQAMSKPRPVGIVLMHAVSCAAILAGVISCGGGGAGTPAAAVVATKASLGKALFFDTRMSTPHGMACATCHSPSKAFTDPRPGFPTSQGVIKGRFGFRKAPSVKYMAYSPEFNATGASDGGAIGGQFWDGRAADLPAQAKLPLLNPLEMNNPSISAVVVSVQTGPEAAAMKQIYGADVFSDANTAYDDIVDAIAEFEKTQAVSPFTSKFDAYLNGKATLTASETDGLAVFNGKGLCSGCHSSTPLADGTPPLFTNYTYANLGIAKNPKNPYYTLPASLNPLGSSYTDFGLGVTTGRASDNGLFKVPTLRNVAITGPYFHNGIYSSLAEVIAFYNSRDSGGIFGTPEVPQTMNTTQVGNLGLTNQEQADLVAFLGTLTDGYSPTP